MAVIENEFMIKQAEKRAREKLKGFIDEDQIGYTGALRREMKKILAEQGIEWTPDDGEILID